MTSPFNDQEMTNWTSSERWCMMLWVMHPFSTSSGPVKTVDRGKKYCHINMHRWQNVCLTKLNYLILVDFFPRINVVTWWLWLLGVNIIFLAISDVSSRLPGNPSIKKWQNGWHQQVFLGYWDCPHQLALKDLFSLHILTQKSI